MRKIAALAVAGLAGLASAAVQPGGAKPRLVVGIVVDQLSTEHIEQLQNLFGQKGFRTFMGKGVYLRDVDYGTRRLDANSGAAALLTGSTPSTTGVPSAMVYDETLSTMRPPLATPAPSGALSNDSFTPEQLRLTTIADEFAIANDGKAVIYSVAADPQQAVILAGHAADGAVWLNNTSGHWATSSYYGKLPQAVGSTNSRSSMAHRIDTIDWRPLPAVAAAHPGENFRYRFARNDRDVYRKVALTPAANSAVTDVAVSLISQLPTTPGSTGMVNIGYTLAPYRYGEGKLEAETDDAYLRLDAQLGRILDAVDRYCGAGNAVIWLSGTGYSQSAAIEDKKYRLPGGEFSPKRAMSLLNAYLVARHGNGEYVAAIRDGNVYLNTRSIEARNLDSSAIAEECREFLARMAGVDKTYTRRQILAPGDEETRALNRAYDPKTGADVIITLMPGWTVVRDDSQSAGSHQRQLRDLPLASPAFIMAPGLAPRTISTPVDAREIAPAISGILRIRPPNGADRRPSF